ncbi:MAG: hypothetical protein WBV82_03365 [Myxococcaceae bacterium]
MEQLLREIGGDVSSNRHIRFQALTRVHFLRWVILPAMEERGQSHTALLAFESNFDGTLEDHLAELIAVGGQALQDIYVNCQGYPAVAAKGGHEPEALRAFLLRHQLPTAAFYRAYPHLSVARIRRNTRVWKAVQAFLDDPAHRERLRRLPPEQIVAAIQQHVSALPGVALDEEQTSSMSVVDRATRLLMESRPVQVALVVVAGPVLVPLLIPPALYLRWKESRDAVDPKRSDTAAEDVVDQEDWRLQNQLTHVVEVKPGLFRRITLNAVLGAINFLARHYYDRGALGGITSIHFARWVLIDHGRRLLFLSNYDGSWERYLGDFIDRASAGLTSVWSNTAGFPRTLFLLFRGATDEQRFKQWARDHQVFTQVWYSAHTEESVGNILENAELVTKLKARLSSQEAQQWLLSL